MRHRFSPSCVLCLALLAAFATQAQGAAKHFRVSYEHFNACASKAADLYFKTNQAGEKNILSHLTAISAIYAEKAYVVMNIVDILFVCSLLRVADRSPAATSDGGSSGRTTWTGSARACGPSSSRPTPPAIPNGPARPANWARPRSTCPNRP